MKHYAFVLLRIPCALVLLSFSASTLRAETIPATVSEFATQVAAGGKIRALLEAQSNADEFYAFSLQQDDRFGFFVIRVGADNQPVVIAADTAVPVGNASSADDNWAAFKPRLIEMLNADRNSAKPVNSYRVINRLLARFGLGQFRSSATADILQDLVQSDTAFVDPAHAPKGCLLVAPTYYAPLGPVRLGQVVLVGTDNAVYGATGDGQPWRKLEPLDSWRARSERNGPVYGFLFRASPKSTIQPR